MRRRDFFSLIGGAATPWPIAARGQLNKFARFGYLAGGGSSDDTEARDRRIALLNGLGKLGWAEGKNLHVEARSGGTVQERADFARELQALKPDLLVAAATTALTALKDEFRIPIAFVQVADPIGGSRIASIARPGGNITGFTNFEFSVGGKWLQILKEVAPATQRVVVLLDGPISIQRVSALNRDGSA